MAAVTVGVDDHTRGGGVSFDVIFFKVIGGLHNVNTMSVGVCGAFTLRAPVTVKFLEGFTLFVLKCESVSPGCLQSMILETEYHRVMTTVSFIIFTAFGCNRLTTS